MPISDELSRVIRKRDALQQSIEDSLPALRKNESDRVELERKLEQPKSALSQLEDEFSHFDKELTALEDAFPPDLKALDQERVALGSYRDAYREAARTRKNYEEMENSPHRAYIGSNILGYERDRCEELDKRVKEIETLEQKLYDHPEYQRYLDVLNKRHERADQLEMLHQKRKEVSEIKEDLSGKKFEQQYSLSFQSERLAQLHELNTNIAEMSQYAFKELRSNVQKNEAEAKQALSLDTNLSGDQLREKIDQEITRLNTNRSRMKLISWVDPFNTVGKYEAKLRELEYIREQLDDSVKQLETFDEMVNKKAPHIAEHDVQLTEMVSTQDNKVLLSQKSDVDASSGAGKTVAGDNQEVHRKGFS